MTGCASPLQAPEPPILSQTPTQLGVDAWRELVSEQPEAGTERKLDDVNRFFDPSEFLDDAGHRAREDYRAKPMETLSNNGGDCEDFTIAEYFTLKPLAPPERKMRPISFKSRALKQPRTLPATMPARIQAAASGP